MVLFWILKFMNNTIDVSFHTNNSSGLFETKDLNLAFSYLEFLKNPGRDSAANQPYLEVRERI